MAESASPAGVRVLLVDDQPDNLEVLRLVLEAGGYRVLLAPSGEVALRNAARARPDLILLDVMMPGMDGFETCHRLKADAATRDIPVIFITARDLGDDVVRGFDLGAVDYVTKPFREREVLKRVETHVRVHHLAAELRDKNRALEAEIARREKLDSRLDALAQRERARWGLEGFVGKSPTIRRIFDDIRLMQDNPATTVLITGESGTGKELIARAIHYGGPRRDGPFLPVNCAALPGELAESLLFGHVTGAFTGAAADRAGYFEAAHEGTLFLDEVGDMAPALQGKLLRVLENGEVWRLGAAAGRQVDVRVVAATNMALQERIATGAFRRDLFYRLARYTVTAPPLRERPDDIPLLAEHFARGFAAEMGRQAPSIGDAALAALRGYDYPGNVRELKNLMERAVLECGGGQIEPSHLHFLGARPEAPAGAGAGPGPANAAAPPEFPLNLDQAVAQVERWVLDRALERAGGNVSAATRLLGTNRNRVYRIMEKGKGGDA